MILIGEGKTHADNLPDATYYLNNKQFIERTLFIDTSHGIRFTPVVLETIKKSHKTLAYILRNQYSNADELFKTVIDVPRDELKNDSGYCFDIFERITAYTHLLPYYRDVCEYIIFPVFKRFGYYSPTMTVAIFVGLLCMLGETYSSQYYGLVWKHFIKRNYPHFQIVKMIKNLAEFDKQMITDEMRVWTSYRRSTQAIDPTPPYTQSP